MPQPSNVIWIFGDQHRAQATGYNGDPNLRTPNLDRLATESAGFNAISGSPLCCPYRGSLLTGLYPHQCVPGHQYPLPDGQQTLATPLREAGYHTAYFGKWHLDGFNERDGRAGLHHIARARRGGFDQWLGYENNNSPWDCHVHGHDASGEEIEMFRLPGFETDALSDLFIDFLGERAGARGTPFFGALSVQPPHNPYAAPARWMERHSPAGVQLRPNVPNIPEVQERARRELAGYYAMIENLDYNVGRIRQALVELDLWEQTHIVFFSDHGDMHGSHGQFLKTAPWEEAARVPFLIGGGVPFYRERVGRFQNPVNHVDIAPTTLGLCGLNAPDWMQGTDYSGFRVGGKERGDVPDSAFMQMVVPTMHGDSVDRPWRGLVTVDGWKYVALEGQPWLMFDLNRDPYEQMNLAHNTRYKDKRRQLNQRLARWIDETGDAFDLPFTSE